MNKKDSVFKIWWYTYLLIPGIFLFLSIILLFNNSWTKTDVSILGWLIIFVTSMIFEIVILQKHSVKYRFEHYMYICLSILIAIFVSFIFTEFVFTHYDHWYQKIFPSLFPPAILSVTKIILWFYLNWKGTSHQNKDNELIDLRYQNKLLSKENDKLRERLKVFEKNFQMYQNQKFNDIQNNTK